MPLTWYGQAWGCDRERLTFAPHQVQQPPMQQPPMQQPRMHPPTGQPPMAPHYGQPGIPPNAMAGMPGGVAPGHPPSQPPLPVIPKTIPIQTFQEQQLAQYPQATQYPASHAIGAQPTAAAPAKTGSSKTVMLAAAGGVVVIAGIAIAVIATRGGGSGSKVGVATRDGLVKATFESMGKDDIDGLMKRSGFPGLKAYVDCDKEEAVSPEKEAEEVEEMRLEMKRALARFSGAQFKVVKITEPNKPEVMAKGAEMGRGCKLKVPVEMHNARVSVEVIHAEGTSETHQVEMHLGKIDNQWFYNGAVKLPGCTSAVARVALIVNQEIRGIDELVNTLQPKLMKHCLQDKWGATIEKCLEGALMPRDVTKCLETLPEPAAAGLHQAMKTALASASSREQTLIEMFPEEKPEKPPEPVAVAATTTPPPSDGIKVDDTYVPDVAEPDPNANDRGRPAQADYGDFWLWTRDDNKVRVTSPLVESVFPGKPEQKLVKGANKTADGKDFWLYQFIYDLGDDGQLRLEIGALGRNARTTTDEDAALLKSFSKIGAVKRRKREVNGVSYTDIEAVEASTGGTLRSHVIRDMKRGIFIIGVAATSTKLRAVGTQYLASIKELDPRDPTEDPELLTGVTAKKAGKKFILHTANDDFSIELPFQPKITRTGPSDKAHNVTVSAIAEKKATQVSVEIKEFASWDGLTYTPDTQANLAAGTKLLLEKELGMTFEVKDAMVAGAPGFTIDSPAKSKPRVQVRMAWNRYQRRTLMVFCMDAKCDQFVESVKWGTPSAE